MKKTGTQPETASEDPPSSHLKEKKRNPLKAQREPPNGKRSPRKVKTMLVMMIATHWRKRRVPASHSELLINKRE
jgi:hypothetical protein